MGDTLCADDAAIVSSVSSESEYFSSFDSVFLPPIVEEVVSVENVAATHELSATDTGASDFSRER